MTRDSHGQRKFLLGPEKGLASSPGNSLRVCPCLRHSDRLVTPFAPAVLDGLPPGAVRAAALLVAAAGLSACSTVPGVEKRPPAAARSEVVPVVATAYGAAAKCNSKWAGRNAIGGRLKSGEVTSAAADWSRFPVGTKFRVKETGRVYVVDDYGSAMVGKDKVDLFKTNYRDVYRWGVRHVNLEILEWGSHEKSLAILKPRTRSRHVKSMVQSLEARLRPGGTQRAG
jgi:3D (Asp-Asp-Asp) domain-containing protein